MARGYRIYLPNGAVLTYEAGPYEERKKIVDDLTREWADYCNDNWISANHEDMYCPEKKVKRFMDSLAYFLMAGNTDGILTDYKEMRNGKTEVPISSCPPDVEDSVYGGSSVFEGNTINKKDFVKDGVGEKPLIRAKKKFRTEETKFDRLEKIKKLAAGGGDNTTSVTLHSSYVDTEGRFDIDGVKYLVSSSLPQYQPKETKSGLLYDMDRIGYVRNKNGGYLFFDMTGEIIPSEMITEEK